MVRPSKPNLFDGTAVDLPSIGTAGCLYPGQPLGASVEFVAVNVLINKAPARFAWIGGIGTPVAGTTPNPLLLPICVIPLPRTMIQEQVVRSRVYINKTEALITPGSSSKIAGTGTLRGIVGPPTYLNVVVGAYKKV